MSERASRMLGRMRWPVLVGWLLLLLVAGGGAKEVADHLNGGGWSVPGSDSAAVSAALGNDFAGRGLTSTLLVIKDNQFDEASTEFTARVGRVIADVGSDDRLSVRNQFGWGSSPVEGKQSFLGSDKRTTVTALGLGIDDGTARRVLPTVQKEIHDKYRDQSLDVYLVGEAAAWGEVNTVSQEGLARAELIAFPLVLVVLLLLYRSVVASLLSLVVGATAVVGALGVVEVLTRWIDISVFVQNTVIMLGLGVGVDYSLFVIRRYLEEYRKSGDRTSALSTTLRTSGETVLFSGLVVVMAMSALFLVDLTVIRSMAIGAIVVVTMAALTSLTVLPVLLLMLGDRVYWGRIPLLSAERDHSERRWTSFAHRVMRRPWLAILIATVPLVAAAIPATQLRTFTPDVGILPSSSLTRAGDDLVSSQFGPGVASPIRILVTLDRPVYDISDSTERLTEISAEISSLSHVKQVNSVVPLLNTAGAGILRPEAMSRLDSSQLGMIGFYVSTDSRQLLFEVVPDDRPSAPQVRDLVGAIHTKVTAQPAQGWRVFVGGETAGGIDANRVISDALPWVAGCMMLILYLLMLVIFRSLLLPLKAIAMNVLSIAATYGLLVLVFQHGIGTSLLGISSTGYLQNFVPILLLALLFSLSTDYEVFLLNRIREEYTATGDNRASVATGLAKTAPLISGAAVLMIAVFAAFTLASVLPIQQLGLGMAISIAIDATLVRVVLVPAAMVLMGRWNWWLPFRSSPVDASASDRDDDIRLPTVEAVKSRHI